MNTIQNLPGALANVLSTDSQSVDSHQDLRAFLSVNRDRCTPAMLIPLMALDGANRTHNSCIPGRETLARPRRGLAVRTFENVAAKHLLTTFAPDATG